MVDKCPQFLLRTKSTQLLIHQRDFDLNCQQNRDCIYLLEDRGLLARMIVSSLLYPSLSNP